MYTNQLLLVRLNMFIYSIKLTSMSGYSYRRDVVSSHTGHSQEKIRLEGE